MRQKLINPGLMAGYCQDPFTHRSSYSEDRSILFASVKPLKSMRRFFFCAYDCVSYADICLETNISSKGPEKQCVNITLVTWE